MEQIRAEREERARRWRRGLQDGTYPSRAALARAVIDSKKTTIRYEGKQYYKDRTLSSADKAALNQVLTAYQAIGGTP